MANPDAVKVGPGLLYIAPVGSTEPTTLTATLDAAWVPIGYTEEGHAFTSTQSFEPIEVAEELLALRNEPSGVSMQLEFAMAEMTVVNLSKALNGGTMVTSGSGPTTVITYEPPAAGVATRVALLWEGKTNGVVDERWVFRKCLSTGDVEIARRKAPDKTTIPVTFSLEILAGGTKPFKAIFAAPA